jgi:phosphoglycolate phosphatase
MVSPMAGIIVGNDEVECSLVLFDLDGTLVDKDVRSTSLARARYSAIERLAGLEAANLWARFSGVETGSFTVNHLGPLSKAPRGEDITVAATAIWLNQLDWFEARELAREAYSEADRQQSTLYRPNLLPGVLDILKEIKNEGLLLGIATNGSGVTAREIMAALTADLFDVYVGADDVAEGKPSPDMIFEACRRLGVQPGNTVYVGDEQADAAAGSAAGVRAIVLVGGEPVSSEYSFLRLESTANIRVKNR